MAELTRGRPAKRARRNSQFAVEYLLGNPTATNEEAVKATGCSSRSISRARAMLVATGQLTRSYFDRQHRSLGPIQDPPLSPAEGSPDDLLPVASPRDPSALERALRDDHGPALTSEQMKQRYSAIARFASKTGEFTLEIQAMQALGRLDSQTGARDRLGPGVPHTREDRRDRVVPILQAAGPSIVSESVVLAYNQGEIGRFLEDLGQRLARKAENERKSQENPPLDRIEGPSEGPAAETAVVEAEIGHSVGDDRGATGPVLGGT